MKLPVLHIAVLATACALTFWNTFHNAFHLDDVYRVWNNVGAQEFWPPWRHFADPYTISTHPHLAQYRPLLPLSLSVNVAICGIDLVGYHVGNLLLHLFASVGAYLFVRELLAHWSKREFSPHAPLLIALLFALHPVGGIPVNYICSRDLSIMQGFLMLALWCYARMRRTGATKTRWAVCLTLLLCSLLAKKNAVVAPVLILLFELFPARQPTGDRTVWRRVAVFTSVVAALLLFVRFGLGFSDFENVVSDAKPAQYFAAQAQHHVFHYLRNFVWPFPMRMYPDDAPIAWLQLTGAAIIIAACVLAWRCRKKYPLPAFCVLAYIVLLGPTSSVLPFHTEIVPYRPYPSSVFFHLGVALLVLRWKKFGIAALGALAIYFGAASFVMNRTWYTEVSLWEHSTAHGATADAYASLGENLPDGPEAEAAFRKAIKLKPDHAMADMGLAMLMIRTGRQELGLKRLSDGVDNLPDNALVRNNYARGLQQAGLLKDAAREAGKCSDLQPDHLDYRCLAGKFAVKAGLFELTLRRLEPLLRTRPSYKDTRWFAGVALFNLGRLPQAIDMLERYLADYPRNAGALFNLGTAYGDAGQFPKAISAFERCVAVNPGYLEAHRLLAQLHRNAGNHAAANRHLQLSQDK